MLFRLGKAQCPKPCFSKVLDADLEAESKHLELSSGCVDAAEGDLCYRTVRWLKKTGLEQHPDWFPTLEAGSSVATIQAELHRQGKSQCPKPCAAADGAPYHALGAQAAGLRTRVKSEDAASWMWDFPKEEVAPTTEAGKAVMECLRKLLHVTPENFDDMRAECEGLVPAEGAPQRDALVKESMKFISWAQHHVVDMRVQRKAQENGDQEISSPAARTAAGEDGCMTAVSSSVCYTAVSYGLSEGIRKHPSMYEGLSEHSSFEKVQDFLWRNNRHGCPKPCPRKHVDITEFDKHPEMLTYKKKVSDMSIDEMTRYINGEWDGMVAKMFDYRADEDALPAATTTPVAEETHEETKIQDMSADEMARVLEGDMADYMPKAFRPQEDVEGVGINTYTILIRPGIYPYIRSQSFNLTLGLAKDFLFVDYCPEASGPLVFPPVLCRFCAVVSPLSVATRTSAHASTRPCSSSPLLLLLPLLRPLLLPLQFVPLPRR
ncbi:unnamed protein product, partial [Prorocentrum cordatum]